MGLLPAWSGLGLCIQSPEANVAEEDCFEDACATNESIRLEAFSHSESSHTCLDVRIELEPVTISQRLAELAVPPAQNWLADFLDFSSLRISDHADPQPLIVSAESVDSLDLFHQHVCLRC